MTILRTALAAALLCAGPALAQMSSGVEVARSSTLRAMVLTVDREAGHILLRNLDTGEVFVHAPPGGMSGMLGVESGDVVETQVTRGVTARPARAGAEARTQAEMMSARTGSDEAGGIVAGTLTTSVVTLTGWDPETGVASGVTPEGDEVEHRVTSDEGRAFLAARSPGDRIEVAISETVLLRRVPR